MPVLLTTNPRAFFRPLRQSLSGNDERRKKKTVTTDGARAICKETLTSKRHRINPKRALLIPPKNE
jgi:hypothetical protein